jgi:hypothetical protein
MNARILTVSFAALTLLAQTPAPRSAGFSLSALVRDPSGGVVSGATGPACVEFFDRLQPKEPNGREECLCHSNARK